MNEAKKVIKALKNLRKKKKIEKPEEEHPAAISIWTGKFELILNNGVTQIGGKVLLSPENQHEGPEEATEQDAMKFVKEIVGSVKEMRYPGLKSLYLTMYPENHLRLYIMQQLRIKLKGKKVRQEDGSGAGIKWTTYILDL